MECMTAGVHKLGSPAHAVRLNFVQWRLIFVDRLMYLRCRLNFVVYQHGTCFASPF